MAGSYLKDFYNERKQTSEVKTVSTASRIYFAFVFKLRSSSSSNCPKMVIFNDYEELFGKLENPISCFMS